MQDLKYRNITISGLPGAGSSTLGKALARVLSWRYFCGGDFMREYAIKKGLFPKDAKVHHPATVYGSEFDRKVDFGMRDWLKKGKHRILEAWISGFFAQGVDKTLKILMQCNDALRIDRVVNRDNISVNEAKKHIFERQKGNLGKWAKLYAKEWDEWVVGRGVVERTQAIDFWRPELYDLTIDTYSNSKEQALRVALKELNFKGDVDYKKVFEGL